MSLERVNLLFMSVHGGILIAVALLLRQIFKGRLPARTFTVLWCVVLLRLLVPCSVSSPFSVYSLAGQQVWDRLAGTTAPGAGVRSVQTGGEDGETFYGAVPEPVAFGDAAGNAGIPGSITADAAGRRDWLRAVGTGGTVVCGFILAVLYLNCLRLFGTAVPMESRFAEQWLRRHPLRRKVTVLCSDRIVSPLTYGVFRPVILLPRGLAEEDRRLEYILQHEMVHIRRFDGALKLLMTAALCLHWFNPLVWVMCIFLNRDVELACDEEVLHTFGREARKSYALTLIGMEEQKYTPASLYSGFGKNAVEERIGAIMKYKDKKGIVIGLAATLVLGTAFFFATSAQAGERGNTSEKEAPLAEGNGLQDTALTDPPVGCREGVDIQNISADSSDMQGVAVLPDAGGAKTAPAGPALFPGMSYASEEDDFRLVYTLEGMEESEPAWLEYGQGYCVLIPKDGWTMSAPGEWVSDINENVTFRVVHFSAEAPESGEDDFQYSGLSRDQIAESLMEQGYQTQYEEYQLYKEENGATTVVEIRSNAGDCWGVVYTYPSEAAEGFGAMMRVMARYFGIIPTEFEGGSDSVDRAAVTRAVAAFALECQKEAERDVSPWLSDSCQWDSALETLTEWRLEELSVRLHPGGDGAEAQIPVRTAESDDSQDYLAMGLKKEEGAWKITWFGLEK